MNAASLLNRQSPVPRSEPPLHGSFGYTRAIVRNRYPANPAMNCEVAFFVFRAFGVWYAEQGWRTELGAYVDWENPRTKKVEMIGVVEMQRAKNPPDAMEATTEVTKIKARKRGDLAPPEHKAGAMTGMDRKW